MDAQSLGEVAPSAPVGQPWSVAGLTLPNRALLAPLSGISDVPFRRLARRFRAGLVVSEMIASGEFVKGDAEAAKRAMADGSGLHAVQLAGRDPTWMRAAAERLAGEGADLIDINFGCPAKKVVGGLSGSALMREPDLALSLVEATVAGAGKVPVTVKMRLGWDRSSMNAPEIARRAEAAGVRMITVHGRTRADFYDGIADWAAIAAVVGAVELPVVANGDLVDPEQLPRMLDRSRANAVMIGRGSQGRPWLPGLLAGAIGRKDLAAITLADLVEEHYGAMLSHYGEGVGRRHARKHLGWYLDRFAGAVAPIAGPERAAVMTGRDPRSVIRQLRHLFGEASLADVEPAFSSHTLKKAA
ncbi:tRNA dihydrouridine synthase DusB [Aurantimonas sp. VKM B-3413]|uniref:tRNA dihydrouridine synthase DusB n=1 Tax=Aurantimonas sp. VKM B-3413 TaxID=2779401 RepID=UPI001E472CB4|nr:tRNA dihydrouridine synthase DusB [Aurantimonas sp. VKM B-3413]MCB8838530.1 tRNA dihydrouridine synthase DusB [Aurantimonas sp. VKM B-3413]